MKKLAIALCLCAFGLFSVPASAGVVKPSASPFLSSQDCFSSWKSYDDWLSFIRAKNAWYNPKVAMLPWVMPKENFNKAVDLLDCRSVTYENDGLTIHGWMVMPKSGKARLPVLIYNRGGNGSFGSIDFATLMHTLFPYAHEGFIVLASQYRGFSPTDPKRFGVDQFGGGDVRDVTKMVELVSQIPRADADNIYMLGASRGAMMSFMAARRTDRIKAMAVIAGNSDLRAELQHRPEMEQVYAARIPDYATRKDQALAERSVVAWAQELPPRMPLLILHGDRDERVHVSNATRLQRRLDQLQRPHKLVIYPGDNHFLSKHRDESRAEILRWFRTVMYSSLKGDGGN